MPTYQRWARMQHGPVAKREFGHDILYPHSKDTRGYSTSGIGNLKYEKFGKVTEGRGGRFKTFKERRIERELENFLRQPTGRGDGTINADVLNSTDIAAIPKFQGYAPDIGTASHKIDKFRSEKELKKITKQIRNIFELTPTQAKAYGKTDPMLSEIYEMGKGLGSLRGKRGLRDMIYRYSDPSRQSFFDTPFQQNQAWLHRLHDRFTPYNPGIPPKAVSLQHRNNIHKTAEQRLRDLDDLVERKLGNEKQIKEWKTEMKEIGEDMELLGLQSDINDITYGKWYADPADKIWKQMMPLFKSMKKEFPLKRLKMMNPQGKVEKYKYKGFDEGGVIDRFQAGGLVGIGSKILAKLAKKLSEKELKMLMGSLWKGVDRKQSGRYKAWAKNRWGPGYKWPYQKSRIRGPEMKKSHYASLSDQAKEDLRKRYAKRLAEYIARKKRGQ